MLRKIRLSRAQIIAVVVTSLLILYQLVRIGLFVNGYGGIEHDGGWMLSISRSLAENGAYTTMISTIVDPSVSGGMNVDNKFDIQTTDGRIWFVTASGIGPASIVPDALVLKIFGTDFWALRAGPLTFYTLLLILAAVILYRLAGLGAIVLFHAYLFFYPHISIFLSYEAMGEVPTMFYILGAYLMFAVAIRAQRWRRGYFFVTGLIAGLALNAKLIALLSISGMFIWIGVLWLVGIAEMRYEGKWLRQLTLISPGVRSGEILWLGGGMVMPLVLWELVIGFMLTRLTSFALYLQHAKYRWLFVRDEGSGMGAQIHSGWDFFWDKFFLLAEGAHPQRWVTVIIFGVILLGTLILLWQWRNQPQKYGLLAPMYFGWLVNTIWFVSLAKTGWLRHFWFGLVLAIMLLCIITVTWFRQGLEGLIRSKQKQEQKRYSLSFATSLVLMALIGWGFVSQPHVWSLLLPDEIIPYWQEKQINNEYHASLPWIIIPRMAQVEIVKYIQQMPPEAKVYYPGHRKTAEIPVQTGRVHYPLNRRQYYTPHPADIVLLGTSLISPWIDPVQRRNLLELVEHECPRPALRNDFYMICPIAENLPRP